MNQRYNFIDTLKALGIFFVVLGHTPGMESSSSNVERILSQYIFSFHMPLFFFISGFLQKKEILLQPVSIYIKKYIKALLVPYVFFSIISYLAWVLVLRHFGKSALREIDIIRPIIGIFYGNGIDGWLTHNVALWFFLCLFCSHILFYLIYKCGNNCLIALFLFVFSLIGYFDTLYLNFRLLWSVDIAFTAVVFFGTSFLIKNVYQEKQTNGRQINSIIILFLFLIVHTISVIFNSAVNMNWGQYGNYFLFYIGAFSGIGFWFMFSKLVPTIRIVSEVGKNTLTIFALHLIAFSGIKGFFVFVIKKPIGTTINNFFTDLLFAFVAIGTLLILSYILKKKIPIAVGN